MLNGSNKKLTAQKNVRKLIIVWAQFVCGFHVAAEQRQLVEEKLDSIAAQVDIAFGDSFQKALSTCESEQQDSNPDSSESQTTNDKEIEKLIAELDVKSIRGFFPTPNTSGKDDHLIFRMLYWMPNSTPYRILEPSAGRGDIADSLRSRFPYSEIDVIEIHPKLREILKLKGHNLVHDDFLTYSGQSYDWIVMNPPFENLQDVRHVRHAYSLLNEGGRIVAIMGKSVFSRTDNYSRRFLEWLEKHGWYEPNPKGTFLASDRKTSWDTFIVIIDKKQEDEQPDTDFDVKAGDSLMDVLTGEILNVSAVKEMTFLAESNGNIIELPYPVTRDRYKLLSSDEKQFTNGNSNADNRRYDNNDPGESGTRRPERTNRETEVETVDFGGLIEIRSEFTQKPRANHIDKSLSKLLGAHQIKGVNLALESFENNGAFLLADGTGAGKTIQELVIAQQRILNTGLPALIVTESENIINRSFAGDSELLGLKIHRYKGRLKDQAINICTYKDLTLKKYSTYVESDSKIEKWFKESPSQFSVVVFDEAHNLKNADTDQSMQGQRLMQGTASVVASATLYDKPVHFWAFRALGYLQNPKQFADFLTKIGFERRAIRSGKQKGAIKKKEFTFRENEYWALLPQYPPELALTAIENLMQDLTEDGVMIRREKSLKGLDVRFEVMQVDDYTLEILDKASMYFEQKMAENPFLKSVYSGQLLMSHKREIEPHKVQKTLSLIDSEFSEGRSVIVMCELVDGKSISEITGRARPGTLQIIEEHCRRKYGSELIGYLHGGIDKEEQARYIAEFQVGQRRILLGTPQSGGTGISLDDTRGDAPRTMILMTPPINAQQNVQIIGRIHRLRTRSDSRVYYLYADNATIDRDLTRILATKMKTLQAAVSGPGVEQLTAIFEDENYSNSPRGKKKTDQQLKLDTYVRGRNYGVPFDLRKGEGGSVKIIFHAPNIRRDVIEELQARDFRPDRYNRHAYYSMDVSQWDYLISLLKSNRVWYVSEGEPKFKEGDQVRPSSKFFEDETLPDEILGTVERVRKRQSSPHTHYYVYNVLWENGTRTPRVQTSSLRFPNEGPDEDIFEFEENDPNVRVEKNDVLGGIELFFDGIPSEELKSFLKLHGFRAKKSRVDGKVVWKWWVKYNDELWDLVQKLKRSLNRTDSGAEQHIDTDNNSELISENSGNFFLHEEEKSLDIKPDEPKTKTFDEPQPPQAADLTPYKQLPVSQVKTDPKRFQGRDDFSMDKVMNIVRSFDALKFDPIVVWRDPEDRQYYVLSGHHRLRAFEMMNKPAIPVRIFEGSFEEAVDFALTDNMKGRPQTSAENAKYLRRMLSKGDSKADVQAKAREMFDKLGTAAYDLAFLAEDGKALSYLSDFQRGTESYQDAETMARWVGKVLQVYSNLSKSQENEIFDYLFKNFRTVGKKFRSVAAFMDFMNKVISRRFLLGHIEPDIALNLNEIRPENDAVTAHQERIAEIKKELNEAKRRLDQKQAEAGRMVQFEGVPLRKAQEVIGPYQEAVIDLEGQLQELQRVDVKELRQSQSALFGLSDGVPGPLTQDISTIRHQRAKPLKLHPEWRQFLGELPENRRFNIQIWGPPGSGKSSLLLALMREFSRFGRSLLVPTEESTEQILDRQKRLGLSLRGADILHRRYEEVTDSAIARALNHREYKWCFIDSLNFLNTENYTGSMAIYSALLNLISTFPSVGFLLLMHSVKDGSMFAGPNKIMHLVDTTIHVENGMATIDYKNRYGPTPTMMPVRR